MSDDSKKYTKADIGSEVEHTIDGVSYFDVIVGIFMPDGQFVIGPQIVCAHIFARYSMVPDMLRCSEETEKMREMMGGGA